MEKRPACIKGVDIPKRDKSKKLVSKMLRKLFKLNLLGLNKSHFLYYLLLKKQEN